MPAYFCTHISTPPGYYNVWVADKTLAEYLRYFSNIERAEEYTHVLTLDIEDKDFDFYMSTLYEDYLTGIFPGHFRRIDDFASDSAKWVEGFQAWKQERIQVQRESWLQQHRKETKGQMNLF